MQKLQTLIDMLASGRNLHVSILDFGGILNTEATLLSPKNTIHSKDFCNVAKSTEKGYRRCIHCKKLANERASRGESFCGYCPFGLFEAAVPVIKGKNVAAVVYAGNFVLNTDYTLEMIRRSARITGVSVDALTAHVSECERITDKDEPLKIAELVRDYLLLLLERDKRTLSDLNWLTLKLKRYADEFYTTDVSLKKLAESYHKNEKYLGRVFKTDMGISFGEYCNSLRLEKAARMLVNEGVKIIDVALECGFNNVAYFNRLFVKSYGVSPTKYRLTFKRS